MSDDAYFDDDDTCWQCGGDGGWNSCMEDTCCAIGGEEGCMDPLCWRKCDVCRGCGFLPLCAAEDSSIAKEDRT